MSAPMGLVAGSGDFPIAFARAVKASGRRVVAVAHEGETKREIEAAADSVVWVRVGQAGKIVDALKGGGCSEAVFLGGITKTSFFDGARPDALGLKLLASVAIRSDDNLLRGIARIFEENGIRVVPSAPWLGALAAPRGVLGKIAPTDEEQADVAYGFKLAKAMGRFDVGQTVVVKNRAPIAVEAIEGTDACIERGGKLAREGAVVVKVVKPGQDARFDLPAAGPRTIEVCAKHKVRVLALEAGGTLLADRAEMVRLADRHGIALVGVASEDAPGEP